MEDKLWKNDPNLDAINSMGVNTMVSHLGIEFIEIGGRYLTARMPVDNRTVQPMRLLHGGASVSLAETLGSMASFLCIDDVHKKAAVGVEINANHLKSEKTGFVYGTVTPIKIGRRMHVWQIKIKNENGELICISRLTTMIIDK